MLVLLLNTTASGAGGPSFGPPAGVAINPATFIAGIRQTLLSADFNGDGRPDLAVAGDRNRPARHDAGGRGDPLLCGEPGPGRRWRYAAARRLQR